MSDLYQNIPAELRDLPRWVLWRFVQVGERKTKVPFQRHGAKASSTDPATWCSFDEATQAQGFDGIGFVFSQDDDICGVDLDHHRGADGQLDPFAVDILKRLDSYAEFSPSGEGIHIILRGDIPKGRKDSARGLEVYPVARYFTCTGRHVPTTPRTVEKRHDAVAALYTEFFQEKQAELPQVKPSRALSLDDATLLSKARAAKDGAKFSRLWAGDSSDYGGDESRADAGLLAVLRFWTGADKARAFALFGQSGLADAKWQRPDYQERTWDSINSGEVYDPAHRPVAPVAAPGGNGLPWVTLPGNGVSVTDCARELFALIGPTKSLFNRGGACMRLAKDDRGQSQLVAFGADESKSFFERHGNLVAWRKSDGGEFVLKPIVCPTDTALALLASQERRDLLPTMRGLLNCPVLREIDGALHVAGRGYDDRTGLFVTGGETPPTVPLDEAITSLWDLLADFAFQTPGDAARAMAGMLAPALKMGGFIKGFVPCEVAEADCSQSGKTYRLRLTAALYNEQPSLVTQRAGGVGSCDESFSDVLVKGRPFVLLDNWRGALSSSHLEAFLTSQGSFPCRIPHRGAIDVAPENFFVQMSSNGVQTTKDLGNRSMLVRIRKQPRGFAFRSYAEGDLLEHVKARQPYFLGCVHSIVREWHRQGMPGTQEHRHDFREWVRKLDWIVQNILEGSPIMEGHREVQERVSNPNKVWLRALMLEVQAAGKLGARFIASELFELSESAGLIVPGITPGTDTERGRKAVGCIMAKLFGDANSLTDDGLTISRVTEPILREDGNGNRDTRIYTISRECLNSGQ